MAVNKVEYNTPNGVETLIDLTEDTVTTATLLKGYTAHTANGERVVGTLTAPVRGVDYWTPTDQEAIVQQVITALGTPVFGTVDADKNIVLSTTGVLADGTYTLWVEGKDGQLAKICAYEHSNAPEPTYTNLFDPSTATLNTRMSGSSSSSKSQDGYVMTAAIVLPISFNVTASSKDHFIVVPASMWTSSANIFLGNSASNTQGYNDVSGSGSTVVGNWAKIPLSNKWGNAHTCDRVVLSLYVKSSAITASDIQNIEIYFNEIPE